MKEIYLDEFVNMAVHHLVRRTPEISFNSSGVKI